MRLLSCATLVLGTLVAVTPASAQMYDPRYPVCMHVFGEKVGERMDCIFTSLAQCAATAGGLPATCLVNPFYAYAGKPMPARPYRSQPW
ncbi:DUF3551 domain-containing protein [Bradyrhizobium lablabi]|uniref:DUF3551 domain-containing protein n=1 Tax=Bradyrhizobium lablabi TaxID=722472 RepID=UPI001BA43CBC|nr:DUF3551 domain-containing protein [Bradyrhizobium lablabi]MBR0692265.1 DUF3551 domain-containing protein [Bradyrhizobium lablabi]